jgi:hypothetical protein
VSDAAITIQVQSNLLADSVVAALVIKADTTDRNEDWPTGKCRRVVFLGAAFFAKSSPVGARLFNFAFALPLNQGDEPTDIPPPFRERIRCGQQDTIELSRSPHPAPSPAGDAAPH